MRHPRRDVIVVGHGIVGAAACWRAAAAGLSVGWLDPDPGNGASHAAAGMLAPITEAEFGEPELLALNLASARRWPDFAAEVQQASGITLGYHRCGVLSVGYDRADHDQLRRLTDLHHRHGLSSMPITADEVRRREPMLRAGENGGYWNAEDGQVDPRRLLRALERIEVDHGVTGLRRRVVTLLRQRGRVIGVVDETGDEHPAELVILAAGHATGSLLGQGSGDSAPTRPVKGEVIRLDGRLPGWPDRPRIVRGFVQQRPIYLVFRARTIEDQDETDHDHEPGEVVIGATSLEWSDDRRVTAGGVFALLRDARAIMPGIDEFAVREVISRARPATPDNLPVLGATDRPGLMIASGHYRNGILLAPITADAFDQIFAGRPPDPLWEPADPGRFSTADNRDRDLTRSVR